MKKIFFIISFGSLLIACGNTSSIPESSYFSSGSSITNEMNSSSSIIESSIDYSFFNLDTIGTWYVHSSSMGYLSINQEIKISNDYSLAIGTLHFSFVGIYEDYPETNLYLSDSGITKFIVSTDGEYLDWGFEDTAGYKDFGTAMREPFSNEIKYSYVGQDWPINQINDYLETSGNIPAYEASEYSLHTGYSQLYNDCKYCMIDIFNVKATALKEYVSLLNTTGFSIIKDPSSSFYIGFDDSKIYGLRIIEYNDNNLCIFVYNYADVESIF